MQSSCPTARRRTVDTRDIPSGREHHELSRSEGEADGQEPPACRFEVDARHGLKISDAFIEQKASRRTILSPASMLKAFIPTTRALRTGHLSKVGMTTRGGPSSESSAPTTATSAVYSEPGGGAMRREPSPCIGAHSHHRAQAAEEWGEEERLRGPGCNGRADSKGSDGAPWVAPLLRATRPAGGDARSMRKLHARNPTIASG